MSSRRSTSWWGVYIETQGDYSIGLLDEDRNVVGIFATEEDYQAAHEAFTKSQGSVITSGRFDQLWDFLVQHAEAVPENDPFTDLMEAWG